MSISLSSESHICGYSHASEDVPSVCLTCPTPGACPRQALVSLLAMVGLPGVGRGEPIPFDHLEDLLGAVADLKEEHAVLKARTVCREGGGVGGHCERPF